MVPVKTGGGSALGIEQALNKCWPVELFRFQKKGNLRTGEQTWDHLGYIFIIPYSHNRFILPLVSRVSLQKPLLLKHEGFSM